MPDADHRVPSLKQSKGKLGPPIAPADKANLEKKLDALMVELHNAAATERKLKSEKTRLDNLEKQIKDGRVKLTAAIAAYNAQRPEIKRDATDLRKVAIRVRDFCQSHAAKAEGDNVNLIVFDCAGVEQEITPDWEP